MKDISEYTVYESVVKDEDGGYIYRIALHPINIAPNDIWMKEPIYNFRVAYCSVYNKKNKRYWSYSCMSKQCVVDGYGYDVSGECIGYGSIVDALQWLIDGEK